VKHVTLQADKTMEKLSFSFCFNRYPTQRGGVPEDRENFVTLINVSFWWKIKSGWI